MSVVATAGRPQVCVRCGRPLRRINYMAGVVGHRTYRVECEHYACLAPCCWSTSDGRHLIATDCAQHAPHAGAQASLW